MSASLTIDGLNEMLEAFKTLPQTLAQDATAIIDGHAAQAAQDMRQGYAAHRRSGTLAESVGVQPSKVTGAKAAAHVTNHAHYARWFEYGTQTRETKAGAGRGAMPPGKVFWPAVNRQYRVMLQDLIGMLQRHGLIVGGGR